ncbi:MAG: radical SAM protein [Desulfobacterales bacterium]
MRFLIVVPKYVETFGDHYDFPLGLAYVSASLKKEGFEVICLNLNHHSGSLSQLLRDTIIEKHIDVFCTGGLSVHYSKVKQLFDIVKGISKKIITIAGGGLITSEPELMLQHMKIDIGVIGEGEQTIIELADAIQHGKKLSKIKGIIYRDSSGKIVKTDKRLPIKNLDCIPYPDYEGFEIEKYLDMQLPNNKHFLYPFDKPRFIPVVSSRSCPFNCTFCFHPLGKQYRQRSLDNFIGEVEYLVKQYNINSIVILDELFSINPIKVKEFSEKMEPYKLKWVAQFRVDQVNIDILKRFKKSGLFYISYGVESASDIILKSMNKKTCVRDIEKTLMITREMKIGIQGNFLFGDPRETLETANETLAWWKKHHFYNINLSQVIPFPGSKIYYYCL